MFDIISKFRGDKTIWAIVILLAIVSFLPVYSASTNLVSKNEDLNTFSFLFKHFTHVMIGFLALYIAHKTPFHYFKFLSIVFTPVIIVLLAYTLLKGKEIDGANASRWIEIPFIGFSFQTSTFAFVVIIAYVARYLSKISKKEFTFQESLWELWLPVALVLMLILPANFSTTALIFVMICMLVYIGNYPLKYLASIIGIGLLFLTIFVLAAKAFPEAMPNRVDTWMSRIDSYVNNEDNQDDYQIETAKIAIASGGIKGLGPGKSVQKNFLPQSSSDFIFSIVIEEYGIFGGIGILTLYLVLFVRFIINAQKATTVFGKLLIIGLGFPIVFQALINMGVAVNLLPVTGQPLPLISSGGTSIIMTLFSIGIILNITKKEQEIALDLEENRKRNEALKQIIDNQVALNEEHDNADYSVSEKMKSMKNGIKNAILEDENGDVLVNGQNPMNAVLNKK